LSVPKIKGLIGTSVA